MTENENLWNKFSPKWLWVIAVLALALLAFSLWLPYGFNFPGVGDEWPMITLNDMGFPIISGTLRPLLNVPSYISYLLTPDSFLGMNIVLALMTFGRGVAIYYLVRRLLPRNPDLALVAGGLTIVYMGDLAFYGLVVVSITSALVAFLIALVALVDYWQQPRWYIIILMWVALAYSVGIYEVSYPLIFVAPLLLFYVNARFNWQFIRVSILWYLVPAIYAAVNLYINLNNPNLASYQLSLAKPNITLSDLTSAFAETYVNVFGRVWQNAYRYMPHSLMDGRSWLVIFTVIVVGIALYIHRSHSQELPFKKGVTLIGIGLIGLALGYSLFAFTSFAFIPFRTLFYGLPFASIALATLAFMLSRLKLIPRIVISVLCLFLTVYYISQNEWLAALLSFAFAGGYIIRSEWRYAVIGSSLVCFQAAALMGIHLIPYPSLTDYQQRVVTTFVKQAPLIQSNTLILWTGTPGTARQYTIIRKRSDVLEAIMRFIYKKSDIEARMCNPDGSQTGDLGEHCRLEPDAVVIDSPTGTRRWTYDRVIAFVYDLNKGAVLLEKIPPEWISSGQGADKYNPVALIDRNAPLPHRLETVWAGSQYNETDLSKWQDLPPW